jgi:hypothetical protein
MPKNKDGPISKACFQCLLWWYAKKTCYQASYEEGGREDYPHEGQWAGYHRYMNIRRAQEIREMSLSDFIDREWVSVVGPMVDPERE